MFRIESCAKQQVCIDDLSEERASAQIRIKKRSDFRWRRAKAWKRCQAWFWIDCNQSLQPNRSQMKCDVWKPCSDQRWQDELRFSIWRFFEQSAFVNNHLLCYWPTIHNSISKICPKFWVLSSHFFKVDELLDEHWAKILLDSVTPWVVSLWWSRADRILTHTNLTLNMNIWLPLFWSTWSRALGQD